MVGAVGADEYGQGALADLARHGVDVSRIAVMGDAATGIALIAVDERGANQIVVAPGANYAFDAAAIEAALAGYGPRAGSVAVLSFELGDEAIVAAVGYASSIMFFTISIGIGLSIAASALVAPAIGAGRRITRACAP
jgi:sugar/nucleoside kinase (ribokinase family)